LPLSNVDIEPCQQREEGVAPVQDVIGGYASQCLVQGVLGRAVGELLLRGEPGGDGEDFGVEERDPQLEGACHGHLVRLDQNVAAPHRHLLELII
jgi:hypothetical protein